MVRLPPSDGIAEAAASEGAEIIVVGTRRRRGAGRMLLGSVSDRLIRTTRAAGAGRARPRRASTVRQPTGLIRAGRCRVWHDASVTGRDAGRGDAATPMTSVDGRAATPAAARRRPRRARPAAGPAGHPDDGPHRRRGRRPASARGLGNDARIATGRTYAEILRDNVLQPVNILLGVICVVLAGARPVRRRGRDHRAGAGQHRRGAVPGDPRQAQPRPPVGAHPTDGDRHPGRRAR